MDDGLGVIEMFVVLARQVGMIPADTPIFCNKDFKEIALRNRLFWAGKSTLRNMYLLESRMELKREMNRAAKVSLEEDEPLFKI